MAVNRSSACLLLIAGVLPALFGCGQINVYVDSRLAQDASLWRRLDGPRYVVQAPAPAAEASLEFEAFSGQLERGLALVRPQLTRVRSGEPTDLVFTLGFQLIDRGTGVETYPRFGPRYGYWCGPRVVYAEVRPVHLGYHHMLFLSTWIPDAAAPAGRRVVWEGHADYVGSKPSLKETMPFLITALTDQYGTATDRPYRLTLEPDDPRVQGVQAAPLPADLR